MSGRYTPGRRSGSKAQEDTGVRFVIEFEDGTTKSYVSGQARYQAFRQLKEQGRDYLVKRQYMTGSIQGTGDYS